MTPTDLKILIQEGEETTLEFKENLSASFARELVAMANTIGGKILLGVRDDGTVVGVKDTEVWCPGLDLVVLRAAARSNNGWAKWVPQENLSFANGYLSFADSRGFALGGPDRCAEDAGKLTIFLHEAFNQGGRGHPSLQNDEEPDAGLIELFDGDSEFMYEVGTALRPPRFAVVRGGRSARTQDLAGNMTPGRGFRQVPDQFNNPYRKRNQPPLERVGGSLRHGILLTDSNCGPFHLIQRKMTNNQSQVTNDQCLMFPLILDTKLRKDTNNLRARIQDIARNCVPPVKVLAEPVGEVLVVRVRESEAIINAVMHRDWFMDGANVFVELYTDRIEVSSPGGLPKGMTLSDLGHKSIRRNALIADLLHRIEFIEKAGTGIKRIRDEARAQGCPAPRFEETGFFTATFFPNPAVRAQVEAQQERIGEATDQVTDQVTGEVTGEVSNKYPASLPEGKAQSGAQSGGATGQVGTKSAPSRHQVAGEVTGETAGQVPPKYPPSTPQVAPQVTPQVEAALAAAREPASREELQRAVGLTDRKHFRMAYLEPLLAASWLQMTIPDKPRSSKQRYRITLHGLAILKKNKETK